jgi:hypothetical protein
MMVTYIADPCGIDTVGNFAVGGRFTVGVRDTN